MPETHAFQVFIPNIIGFTCWFIALFATTGPTAQRLGLQPLKALHGLVRMLRPGSPTPPDDHVADARDETAKNAMHPIFVLFAIYWLLLAPALGSMLPMLLMSVLPIPNAAKNEYLQLAVVVASSLTCIAPILAASAIHKYQTARGYWFSHPYVSLIVGFGWINLFAVIVPNVAAWALSGVSASAWAVVWAVVWFCVRWGVPAVIAWWLFSLVRNAIRDAKPDYAKAAARMRDIDAREAHRQAPARDFDGNFFT